MLFRSQFSRREAGAGLAAGVTLSMIVPAFAATPNPYMNGNFSGNRMGMQGAGANGQAQQAMQAKCAQIIANIPTYVSRYNSKKADLSSKVSTIQAQIASLASKPEFNGLDTTALTAAVAGMQPLLDKLLQDADVFSGKVQDMQSFNCSDTSGYSAAISSLQAELTDVKTDIASIQSYYQTKIKPEVEALKAQAKTMASSRPRTNQ